MKLFEFIGRNGNDTWQTIKTNCIITSMQPVVLLSIHYINYDSAIFNRSVALKFW